MNRMSKIICVLAVLGMAAGVTGIIAQEGESVMTKNCVESTLAGSWYDANPVRLKAELEGYLEHAQIDADESIVAVVVPHAGYALSLIHISAGRAQLGIQYQAFADLLGLPLESRFELVAPDLLALDEADASRAVAVALACRPDYAQALQDIETADRQLRIARRQLLPDLRLTARHTSYGEGEEWREAGRLDESDWFVGLMGELNLNVREARLGVRRAAIDAEARRQVAEIVRNRLALEVNAGWAQYRQARTQLDLAARNAGLAANRAELARSLFEAGRASADSVSDAEMDRVNAELSELAARREASVAAYRLLHGLGTLVPAPPEILAQEER